MRGLLAGFGGVWKTWLKSLYAICLRTQFGCKNTNKYMSLTIVGMVWNELVRLNVNGIRAKSLG